MLDTVFRGLFDTALTDTIAPGNFLLCVGVSLILGLLLCAMTGWQSRSSLTITLALLPAVVCVYDGQRQCGHRRSGSWCLQLGTFPLCPWHRPGDLGHLCSYGHRPDRRHGISGLRNSVCSDSRCGHYGIHRFQPSSPEQRPRLPHPPHYCA